ncbi:MAG: nickel pincer cofactor biosynthesis protein LarB [Actinomycetota bacterium]
MRPDEVQDLLAGIKEGSTSIDEAVARLRRSPTEDLGYARLDVHRELRQGLPEAIYAEGKTTEQVLGIAARLLETTGSPVLATRCSDATAEALLREHPDAVHHQRARLVVLRGEEPASPEEALGSVTVVCAGTSDLPVAEEALYTSRSLGAWAVPVTDVGVAGLHRLLEVQDALHEADVVIVVAGMEGALASIVGGLASAPVVAVPTSVGYGASFDGLAALLTMLNSCAAGVTVCNIDNGFGAAVFAHRLLNKIKR